MLPTRQLSIRILRLRIFDPFLELLVRGEIDSLVRTLSDSGKCNTTVQSTKPLLLDNGVRSMRGVSVLGYVKWVRHRMVLCLQSNFDDFHRCDAHHRLCYSCAEAREEDSPIRRFPCLRQCERAFVSFEGRKPDCHFGNNPSDHGY